MVKKLDKGLDRIYENMLDPTEFVPKGRILIRTTVWSREKAIIYWPDKKEKRKISGDNFNRERFLAGIQSLLEEEDFYIGGIKYRSAFLIWPSKVQGYLYKKMS